MLDLQNKGSLITVGEDQCLGYLFNFAENGIFDPSHGRVEVTPEEANAHNALLDEALLKGLDQNCKVGQGGTFYWTNVMPKKVTTWLGTIVSDQVTIKGNSITFIREGKTYRGRLHQDDNAFNFRRVK